MSGSSSLILYFIQGELGESIDSPNAFVVQGANGTITMAQFQQSFPVKNNGNLHYRFQADDKTFGYVWKDVKSPSEVLPTYMGTIMAKILKLDSATCIKRKSRLRKAPGADYSAVPPATARRVVPEVKQNAPPKNVDITPIQPPASRPTPTVSPAPNKPVTSPTVVPPPKAPTPPVVSPPVEHNFFQDDGPIGMSSQPVSKSSSQANLSSSVGIDIDDDAPSAASPLSREDLVRKREEAIQSQVDEALQEKLRRDEAERQAATELEAARLKHDKQLLAWATNNNEKRNVRTLLSTMHTVLWDGANWKPIGLGDVLAPNQVKLQYRKAMLVVHPDRCSSLDTETKFIGKRIFEALNEAYTQFLEKENV